MTRVGVSLLIAMSAVVPARGDAQRAVIDTTWRFDVPSRTWTWPYVSAQVGLGCRDDAKPVGITTAPDTTRKHAASLCAAALVEMRESTLTLTGARGVVRLRAPRFTDTTRIRDTVQPRRLP